MDLQLMDKLYIENSELIDELEDRNINFRTLINNKKYDTCHEDFIAKYIINCTKWKDMLLIRYDYYLSRTFHGLGKGDMVFYEPKTDKLYVIELKSLKDKYTPQNSNDSSDNSKIEKCILQSIKYARYALIWAKKEAIPITAIEYSNGDIIINEHTESYINPPSLSLPPQVINLPNNSDNTSSIWSSNPWKRNEKPTIDNFKEIIKEDQLFEQNDQTQTKYKIIGDTLEVERIVSEASSELRKSFKKRVQYITEQCTTCTKYLLILKNLESDILMQEYYELGETL